MLLGSAYFCDLLKPSSTLCKILQEEDVCVVRAIESVMKTSNSGDKLKATNFEDLPTVKKVMGRMSDGDVPGSKVYQGVLLMNYEGSSTFLKGKHQELEYITRIQDCLRDRVKIQSTEFLTHAITILATHGWEKSANTAFGCEALEYVSTRFLVPLENTSVNCAVLNEEWDDIVEYAKRYLNLVQDDYKVIWWKLFNSPDSTKWTNVLAVVELLFCLPVSNSHLERVFSQLKLVKSERRTCLGEDRLDQLVRISVEAPVLAQWDPSSTVELWWRDKTCQLNIQDVHARPTSSSSSAQSVILTATLTVLLLHWTTGKTGLNHLTNWSLNFFNLYTIIHTLRIESLIIVLSLSLSLHNVAMYSVKISILNCLLSDHFLQMTGQVWFGLTFLRSSKKINISSVLNLCISQSSLADWNFEFGANL